VNYLSGVLFVAAVATTIFFVSGNINGESPMKNNIRQQVAENRNGTYYQNIHNGREERGATIPPLQPLPSDITSQQSSSQNSQVGSSQGSQSDQGSEKSEK
jgi:hypothetical protein